MKNQMMQAIVKWVEKQVLSRTFKRVWYWRMRWMIVLLPLVTVEPALAQSFVADVDYQLQRQYKGPFLRHEVFTNAAELAAYVSGGAQSRAYAGQVVVLVEGGVPVTYTLGSDGTNMVTYESGGAPAGWSEFPATTDVDMGGHSVTGAADVVTAGGVSLAETAALAAVALQTNQVGDVGIVGDLSVSGSSEANRLVASGLYDESGRSIPSIAADSAVRYDVGKAWEALADEPTAGDWSSIAWSPKLRLFVAVSSSTVAYSRDGANWTLLTSPVTSAKGVVWAPELGLFVVVTDSSRGVALSGDGLNWSTAPSPPEGNIRGVAWSQELHLLVAVGAYRIVTSSDGMVWTTTTASSLWNDVCWSPELGLFVASSSGAGQRIAVSEDGVNWTFPTVPDNYFLGVEWSPELGVFVAVGSRGGTYSSVIVSADGANWTEVPSAPKSGWNHVCWSSEARCFVAVSYSGQVMRSKDAYTWSLQPVPVVKAWWSVEWSPLLRTFIAGGAGGAMLVSTVDEDVSTGSLSVDGTISATGDMSVGGNVQLGTVFGTNVIAGDTQIGNSERRLDINQKGLAIVDAVTEITAFAVEQYAPSHWRVDLKGNALTNAGVVSAGSFIQNGTNVGALAAAALSSNIWATAPGTTNYMPRTVQVLTNAALQSGINARVPTNDIRYLASLTNAAAFATKAQGTRADLALTNLSFGVTGTVAYRGDWGQSASNLAYAASTGKVDKTDSSYSRTNHWHGIISDEGKIGVTPGFLVETAAGGVLGLKPKGTTEQWLRGDGQWSEPAGWQNTANATNWTWELVIWGDDPEHFGDWQNRIVARLTGYSGPPHCVVPDYLDGHPVAILGGDWDDPGWADPESILTITAGPNLDYITAFAIVDLTNLYLFNAPGVTRLGEGAFVGCTRLEELRFPKTMEYVEGNSLFNLSNLQAVYWGGENIPDNNPYGGTTTQVVTYVTNPTASNWPDVFYGHPLVRMAVTASNVVAHTITADNYGEVTAAGITLGGVRRASWPGSYWPAQSATYKEYKFPAGDLLYGDGTNLFYVPASGTVTNKITAN